MITDAGELEPSDPSLTETVVVSDGDPYEDYPEDDFRDTEDSAVVLEAARTLRELGTARWKDGSAADALAKWQKALRYLDVHPVLPDDAPSELVDEFTALRTPLLLNSALAAFKAPGGVQGAQIALSATSATLELPKLADADRGTWRPQFLSRCARGRYLLWLGGAPHLQRRHCIDRVSRKSRSRNTMRQRRCSSRHTH